MSVTTLKQAVPSIFTFIDRKSVFSVLLLSFFLVSSALADSSADNMMLLVKAQKALNAANKKRADYYAARYLAVCGTGSANGCSEVDLQAFIKNRKLSPKGFLSADWDPGFLDWFERAPRESWGVEDNRVREKYRSFEISQSAYGKRYFATIVAYPELELWYEVKNGIASRPLLLTMGSFRERPTIFFGKILNGQSLHQFSPLFLDTQKKTLHYVWKPEFFDLDGDDLPEVWIRFNIAWGNGFSQVLDIYKIKDERELVLFKRFQGIPEGMVRRLPDGHVEVASRVSSQRTADSAPKDKHHLETWEYDAGEFKKISEEEVPFILETPEWAEYFNPVGPEFTG